MLNSLAEGITLRYIRQVKHARRPTLCVRPYGNPRYSSHLANIYAIPYTLSRSLSKSPRQIKALAITRKHLKVRAVSGGTPCSPRRSRDGTIRSARPATAGMSAIPPLAVARAPTAPLKLSCLKPYTTELSQTLYFGRLVSTGRAGVAEWQTQRT